ncbi:hypothetical protein, partial [Pseudodesulfovibrio sp. S3]|uniref:hypothetical protein n=1 Tax=Pseudodesulfovibrio sp. S3 TaxID=2283629 RepID=UPI001007FF14
AKAAYRLLASGPGPQRRKAFFASFCRFGQKEVAVKAKHFVMMVLASTANALRHQQRGITHYWDDEQRITANAL